MQGKEHEDKEQQEKSIKQYQVGALGKFWTISLPLYWMTLQRSPKKKKSQNKIFIIFSSKAGMQLLTEVPYKLQMKLSGHIPPLPFLPSNQGIGLSSLQLN